MRLSLWLNIIPNPGPPWALSRQLACSRSSSSILVRYVPPQTNTSDFSFFSFLFSFCSFFFLRRQSAVDAQATSHCNMGWFRKLKYCAKKALSPFREGQQRQASKTSQTSDTRVACSSDSAVKKSARDSDQLSKDESSHRTTSLWDRAYEALRVDDPKLVAEYETLLNRETRAMGISSRLEHSNCDASLIC